MLNALTMIAIAILSIY